MKKVLLTLSLLLIAGSASAQWHHEYRDRCCYRGGIYYGGNNWVAPALIGGVIGYELSRPRTEVIVEQQPIVVQQSQIVLGPNDVILNGVVYTRQLTVINGITQEVLIKK